MFVPGKPFQPSPMFAGKIGAYPRAVNNYYRKKFKALSIALNMFYQTFTRLYIKTVKPNLPKISPGPVAIDLLPFGLKLWRQNRQKWGKFFEMIQLFLSLGKNEIKKSIFHFFFCKNKKNKSCYFGT